MNKNWLEWLVFGVSLLLVGMVVGYLAWDAFSRTLSPPNLITRVVHIDQVNGHYRVAFEAYNRGGQTAEGVTVEGTVIDDEGKEEKASVEFAYVPRESIREGWLQFRSDPRNGTLELFVLGYEKP